MDVSITLPSNASGNTFPENTLATYRVLLQKYLELDGPHLCALSEVTLPTKWYNMPASTMWGVQFQAKAKRAARTTSGGEDEGDDDDDDDDDGEEGDDEDEDEVENGEDGVGEEHVPKKKRRVSGRNRLAHVRRVLESNRRPPPGGGFPLPRTSASGGSPHPTVPPTGEVGRDPDEDGDAETPPNRTFIAEGPRPFGLLPDEVKDIEALARREYPQRRDYTQFSIPGGRASGNADFIRQLNRQLEKKQPEIFNRLRAEKRERQAHGIGPEQVFNYDEFTMKTWVALPRHTMLYIPEYLSYQLGLNGRRHLGRRARGEMVTDVDYRNHTVYVYTDIIHDCAVGDTQAPLLRSMAIDPQSPLNVQTFSFPNLIFHPLKQSHFKEITVYLRDSTGRPIPFEHGEVSVVLTFRKDVVD